MITIAELHVGSGGALSRSPAGEEPAATPRLRSALQTPTLVLAACWLALAAPTPARAQWRVVDEKGNQHLAEIRERIGAGDVNARLRQLHDQQRLARYATTEHGGEAAAPGLVLDRDKPSTAVDIGVEQRCPSDSAAHARASQQGTLCEEMVATELARYRYSVQMYEVALVRSKRLGEIERERLQIGEDQQGRLQDNSNKLLALLSRMQVDRQQHQTYMDAYDARLRYLSAAHGVLAAQAMEGDRSPAAVPAAIATLGTLALALEGVRTERRDWRAHRR